MRRAFLLLLPLLLFFAGNSYGVRLTKIGVVDVEAVFNAYPGTADIRQKLKEERDKYQIEIDKKKEELAKMGNDYQANYSRFNEEERQRRQAEVEYKKELLNEFIEETNKKLNALKEELTKPIYLKIQEVIKRVSAEKGFSLVFRKGSDSLLYFNNSEADLDLTKDIVSRISKELSIEQRN
jgi:Skp family chaperone for outer membrane proteins